MSRRHDSKGLRLAALVRRFRDDCAGASAVEFALVASPFIGMIFAVIQTSIALFAGQALQTMVTDTTRKIMTGQTKDMSLADFRTAMCGTTYTIMFDCNKVYVQVKSYANFAAANPSTFMDANCFKAGAPASCFDPGEAEDVVLVRVSYDWPFGINLQDIGRKQTLVAVGAFRNEPY